MGRAKDEEGGGGKQGAAAPEKDGDGERSTSEPADASGAPGAPGAPGEPSAPAAEPKGKRDWHRLIALAMAAAVLMLFPMLAKSGIWDPYELDAADLARRIAPPRLRRARARRCRAPPTRCRR